VEEPLFHRHLSAGKAPGPTVTRRFDVASATKQHKKTKQSALLLKGVGEQYTLVTDHGVPTVAHEDEILVKVQIPPIVSSILTSLDHGHWVESHRLERAVSNHAMPYY
jgi:hypothetical protein